MRENMNHGHYRDTPIPELLSQPYAGSEFQFYYAASHRHEMSIEPSWLNRIRARLVKKLSGILGLNFNVDDIAADEHWQQSATQKCQCGQLI
jgi:hypothetical protein